MSEPLLSVEGLSINLVNRREAPVPIVRNVSFQVKPGEALGIVGESGSGKSVTLSAIRRTLSDQFAVEGSVRFDGDDVYAMSSAKLRSWHSNDIAVIYQDPRAAMNPVRTVGDFITESLRRRTSRGEAAARACAQLRAVGIVDAERRLNQYPHELSGGLLQRVVIASALLDEPRLILADEPTTALDVTTQEEVMAILAELRQESGVASILVTHDLDLAAAVSDRIATFYAGSLVELGTSADLHDVVIHPYSRALLDSRPSPHEKVELRAIPGRPASASEVGPGCSFSSRCPLAIDICSLQAPDLVQVQSRLVACHRSNEIVEQNTLGGTR